MFLAKHQIKELFDFPRAAEAVRQSYIASAQGRVQAPEVTYLGFPDVQGDCHVKTAHVQGAKTFVIKVTTGFYRNPSKGLPSSNGINLVFSARTGELVATLQDEGWLTDMRTALGGAIATLALANAGFQRVLIVGAGIQARLQAQCLQALRPDQSMVVSVWGRSHDAAVHTAQDLRALGLAAHAISDLQEACAKAEVIITTTPAQDPIVQQGWVKRGTHITAIGADCPSKQELAPEIVTKADLRIVDLAAQSLHHGEFQTAHRSGALTDRDVIALGDVLSGAHPGRTDPTQITVTDLTGLAAQDAAISGTIIDAATQLSL